MNIALVTIILLATIVLLITEKLPIDMTAIALMVILIVLRLLTPQQAVAGLASPAVITVGCMFIISEALIRTGVIAFISQKVIHLSKGNALAALITILFITATASAFMNNTPVVVLFIPVVMTMCCEFGLSPSKFLIPVSYASILAGTCTLIGTSTNIIVSDLSAMYGYGELGMFELAIVGLPITITGLIFLLAFAFKIMPGTANPVCELEESDKNRYLAEITIPVGSTFIGHDPIAAFSASYPNLEILEFVRDSLVYYPGRDKLTIAANDLLLVKGTANDIVNILRNGDTELPSSEKELTFSGNEKSPILVEFIISPHSDWADQKLRDTELVHRPDLHVIAIKRTNLRFTAQKLEDVTLKVGDILLALCPANRLDQIRADGNVIIVENVHDTILNRSKAKYASSIFAGFLIFAALGLADIMSCALAAVFLMTVTGCVHLRDAYRSLQPNVLLLIAATIGLGMAMDKTGASQYYADTFLRIFENFPPIVILGAIMLVTSVSTQLLSNNATAVLILPLAISTALELGLNPKPFIVAVCLGASACFATPIGYQTNLLVFGPGGYRFKDYIKLGLPLNLLTLIIGTVLIPIFWTF